MQIINYISYATVPIMILIIISHGLAKRIDVFDNFITGAKEGIQTTINILPTLIGLFVGISMLRASGTIELISSLLAPALKIISLPHEVLPLALIRPISGSGALAVVNDILKNFGPDSMEGRTASVMMGSTETTFYTIAIYFGYLKIKDTRYAVKAALIADVAGIIMSALVVNLLLK